MSEDRGDMTSSGKQGKSSDVVPAGSPLEDDNLLSVILCRLPSVPSSLLRASLVCKPWRFLASDPRFLREFRAHHQKPPLLGFFSIDFFGNIEFTTMLDPSSDCIPAERFSLRVSQASRVLRSHHGRVLVLNQQGQQHFLVWDPVTGELLKRMLVIDGGVVCAATDQGHVHGACHPDPFRVVFIGEYGGQIFACVYSSETRAWGNLFTMTSPLPYFVTNSPKCPSTLVRNSICMLIFGERAVILEFDWGRGTLAHLDVPSDAYHFDAFIGGMCQFMVTPADDSGGLSFIFLSSFSVHVWKRVSHGGTEATWMLGDTIELRKLLSLEPMMHLSIMGLDEDKNVIFKLTDSVVFTVNLESVQFKKLST